MATVSDLAKLRIDRDAPPPAVRRALLRAVWLAAAAVGIVGAVALWLRGGSPTLVQVVTASLSEGGGGGRGGRGQHGRGPGRRGRRHRGERVRRGAHHGRRGREDPRPDGGPRRAGGGGRP